jgi:retron-type reverse transcriptase
VGEAAKSGRSAEKRVIPGACGETGVYPVGLSVRDKRPIGIPTYEDKILQRAVQLVLEPIYEQEFYDFSYGFRPGKSAHQCLNRIWKQSMTINGGYIIDMDISKYANLWFDDPIPHETLREILGQRVSDG